MLITNFGSIASQGEKFLLPGWSDGKMITIPSAQIDAELSNFPVSVFLNESNFDFSIAKVDGADIRFTDKNFNPLKFERKEHGSQVRTTVGGSAISGGTEAGYTPSNAFDDYSPSNWASSQTGTAVNGAAWLGYNFLKNIKIKTIQFYNTNNVNQNPSSWKVQYSSNGTTWTDAQTFAVETTIDILNTFNITGDFSAKYWRVIANSAVTAGYRLWISELYMYSPDRLFADYNVFLPTISSTQDTEFYMWYGNPNAYNASIEAWQDMTGKALTYNGNVVLKDIGDRALFNGINGYFTMITNPGFDFGTGNFSIETKVIFNGTGNASFLDSYTDASNYTYFEYYAANNRISFESKIAGVSTGVIWFLFTPEVGVEYDIQFARSGDTAFAFVNGILQTVTGSFPAGSVVKMPNTLFIGKSMLAWFFNGYMKGFRITRGVAVKTDNYTPEEVYPSKKTGSTLNINFVEPVDSTVFRDFHSNVITTYGNVKVKGFIKSAAVFDGAGDFFSLADSDDWTFGTGDFTIEARINLFFRMGTAIICGQFVSSTVRWVLAIDTMGALSLALYNSSTLCYCSTAPLVLELEAGKEAHIEVSRSGSSVYMFVNGVAKAFTQSPAITAATSFLNLSSVMSIGTQGADSASAKVNGKIYGIRITKGTVRHTTDFTPPTSFDIDGSDVVLCTNFDTIYDANYAMVQHMGTSLVDATGNGNNGTATGTTVVDSSNAEYYIAEGTLTGYTYSLPVFIVTSPSINKITGKFEFATVSAQTNLSNAPVGSLILIGAAPNYESYAKITSDNGVNAKEMIPYFLGSKVNYFGKARSFNGSSDRITIPDNNSLDFSTAPFTVLALHKVLGTRATNKAILSKTAAFDDDAVNYCLDTSLTGTIMLKTSDSTGGVTRASYARTPEGFISSEFIVATGRYKADKTQSFFIDRFLQETVTALYNATQNAGSLYIGSYFTSAFFGGIVGEVRLSNVDRLDSWIKAETLSLKNELVYLSDIEFKVPAYNFGNGSLNLVSGGYNGLLYNKQTLLTVSPSPTLNNGNSFYNYTLRDIVNSNPKVVRMLGYNNVAANPQVKAVVSGVNTIVLNNNIPKDKLVTMNFLAANLTSGVNISAFKINFSGVLKTLQEAVNEGLIEPMVLMNAHQPVGSVYVWLNWMNMYTGGTVDTINYPHAWLLFVTKTDTITGYVFTTNKAWATTYPDGIQCNYIDKSEGIALSPF